MNEVHLYRTRWIGMEMGNGKSGVGLMDISHQCEYFMEKGFGTV